MANKNTFENFKEASDFAKSLAKKGINHNLKREDALWIVYHDSTTTSSKEYSSKMLEKPEAAILNSSSGKIVEKCSAPPSFPPPSGDIEVPSTVIPPLRGGIGVSPQTSPKNLLNRDHKNMQCKTFYIRIREDHTAQDEAVLNDFLKSVEVVNLSSSLINEQSINFWSVLIFYRDKKTENDSYIFPDKIHLTPMQEELYEILRQWRIEHAKEDKVSPYMIAHNQSLTQIAYAHDNILKKDDLLRIKGFGSKRIEKYGEEILDMIEFFRNNHHNDNKSTNEDSAEELSEK